VCAILATRLEENEQCERERERKNEADPGRCDEQVGVDRDQLDLARA
jgi:hypothetical protein